MGISVKGKELIPILGELNPDIVDDSFFGKSEDKSSVDFPIPNLPPRPPNMCPGCPHRGVFYSLSRKKVFVAGDIGCYTLAFLPPLKAIDTCLCMGASIGHAVGMNKALGKGGDGKVCAVIGDSTFFHSGVTPLMDAAYNLSTSTIIILDNRTTAMTGTQENPGTGKTILGESTIPVDIKMLANSFGIKRVREIDPYDLEETKKAIDEELDAPETSVIISKAPCVLLPEAKKKDWKLHEVKDDLCTGCRVCIMLGCPALGWDPNAKNAKGKEGRAYIDPLICIGCGVCSSLCKDNAIVKV
jgi:indolepyruvate ferredoxin oxidoreductase alpha subunit